MNTNRKSVIIAGVLFLTAMVSSLLGGGFIEAVFCFAAAIIPLFLAAISQEIGGVGASETASFQTMGTAFIATRAQLAGTSIPLFFGLAALLFYFILYQSKLLPRFISIWGFIGASLILASTFMDTGLGIGMTLALPMILNEIFLGIWLIVKGFKPTS